MLQNKETICIDCKERPILIKKHKLCARCYQRQNRKNYLTNNNYIQRKREVEFIKNYFTHKNWIHEPATFSINAKRYTPDFYDAERNVWIEVSGTRQAYHANKDKYEAFRKYFPRLKFEIRKPNGKILGDNPYNALRWA